MHMNSISIDPSDGNVVISGRNTCACYKVNRKTGQIMWRLGGKHSDFQMGAGTRFNYEHDVNIHAGGVLSLFDNEGGPPRMAGQSRALVLAVDQRRRQVRLKHAFHHQPGISPTRSATSTVARWRLVRRLGPFLELHALWQRGTGPIRRSPVVRLELVSRLSAGLDRDSDRATGPRRDALRRRRNGLRVVERLRPSCPSGSCSEARRRTLQPIGIASATGFETAVSVSSAPACLAVTAADSSGNKLATSHVSISS